MSFSWLTQKVYVIRIHREALNLFISLKCVNGSERTAHVCSTSPDASDRLNAERCRRPISRAKLFITEVHIRTSGRPALRARLGGNYHFL